MSTWSAEKTKDENCEYQVWLDGKLMTGAIEADEDQGWVIVETKIYIGFGVTKTETKKHYGNRIHIVKVLPALDDLVST